MTRRARAAAILAAAALSVAACGDDDSDSGGSGGSSDAAGQQTPLAVKVVEQGKTATLTMPKTANAGAVKIDMTNSGKQPHSLQLARIDEGHSAQEVLQAGDAWASGKKPLPPWAHLAGGLGSVEGGKSGSATVVLEPGKYVALDTDAEGQPPYAEFEVKGDGAGRLPDAPASIEAKDYSFTASGLSAGKNTVTFENTGQQPHVAAGIGMAPGATLDDVKKFFETEKGKPPIDESKNFGTGIIDGGGRQIVELDLKPGKYAVVCFVPDREGGPPHEARGMISEVDVK